MRDVLAFGAFAQEIDNRLWLLGIEPRFELCERRARWSCAPYAVDLQAIDRVRARIVLSDAGTMCHASEPGAMTLAGAQALARALGMLFAGRGVVTAETRSVSSSCQESVCCADKSRGTHGWRTDYDATAICE